VPSTLPIGFALNILWLIIWWKILTYLIDVEKLEGLLCHLELVGLQVGVRPGDLFQEAASKKFL